MEITNEIFSRLIVPVGLFTGQAVFALDVPAGEITSGRARALVGVAVALVSIIVGGLALMRPASRLGSVGAIAAPVLGLIGIVLGVLHLSASTGGFGTGGGRLGAIVGLVLGLIGVGLGGLALARARRSDKSP